MRAPSFWWEHGSVASALLAPAGWAWGFVAGRRMDRAGTRAEVPVVCIGNLIAGGAGKTPTALAVARLLADAGRRPVFLSRGYGGSAPDALLVDPSRHRADLCGDEPLLLAAAAPTVVSPDRVAGARLAARLGDVIVMDDGLQNPSLAKDLSIAVVDAPRGIGNGRCIPAGPLRAPIATQWRHVDAVLVVGQGAAGDEVAALATGAGIPVLRAALVPDDAAAARLRGRRVLAFAGIGHPARFFDTLRACGADVVEALEFADHYAFAQGEATALVARSEAAGLLAVTTKKDLARLDPDERAALVGRLHVLPVTLRPVGDGLAGLLATLR
ncbi:tetraacyldisaccharide 4'-kinase [Alsobacter sp. R-9]